MFAQIISMVACPAISATWKYYWQECLMGETYKIKWSLQQKFFFKKYVFKILYSILQKLSWAFKIVPLDIELSRSSALREIEKHSTFILDGLLSRCFRQGYYGAAETLRP